MFLFLQAGWDKTIRQLAYESRPHLVQGPCLGKMATSNKYKIWNLGSTDEYYRPCANYSGYH